MWIGSDKYDRAYEQVIFKCFYKIWQKYWQYLFTVHEHLIKGRDGSLQYVRWCDLHTCMWHLHKGNVCFRSEQVKDCACTELIGPSKLARLPDRVPHHVSQGDVVYEMNELWFACCLMLIKISQRIPGHEANEVHKQTDTFVISPAYVWEELWNINVVMLV